MIIIREFNFNFRINKISFELILLKIKLNLIKFFLLEEINY